MELATRGFAVSFTSVARHVTDCATQPGLACEDDKVENIVIVRLSILSQGQSNTYEPRHEISSNVVCVTSKGSDQPAHMRSLIRAFASRLSIL